jgi:hypothetical protein
VEDPGGHLEDPEELVDLEAEVDVEVHPMEADVAHLEADVEAHMTEEGDVVAWAEDAATSMAISPELTLWPGSCKRWLDLHLIFPLWIHPRDSFLAAPGCMLATCHPMLMSKG